MKRFLTYFLLIANLCSGVALAWDTHPEAMVGHDSIAINLMDDDHDHSDGDFHHDDHSCHGSAHLIGILPAVSTPLLDMKSGYRVSTTDTLPSLYIPPLLRPPIV